MDKLIEIQDQSQEAVLSLAKASALSVIVTMLAVLGAGHGHMEEIPSHSSIPIIYNGARHSRRIDQ